jgi:hypothetical protein
MKRLRLTIQITPDGFWWRGYVLNTTGPSMPEGSSCCHPHFAITQMFSSLRQLKKYF